MNIHYVPIHFTFDQIKSNVNILCTHASDIFQSAFPASVEALITLGHTDIWLSRAAVTIYKSIRNISRFHLLAERGTEGKHVAVAW